MRWIPVLCLCTLLALAAPARAVTVPAHVDGARIVAGSGGAHFWPGVNLGSTVPGSEPGEVAATRADYDRWLAGMGDLGVKVVRIYTILRPSFYDALAAYNAKHPSAPIYFIQGVWLPGEEDWYASGNAYEPAVTDTFKSEIADAVAAVHGDATIPARPGHASGDYKSDVARWLLAYSPGIEWDPASVESTDAKNAGVVPYRGRYITATAAASPMESWIASMLDYAASLDAQRGWSRPMTFTNWVTTDPLVHPEEPFAGEDSVSVDATHLHATADWPGGFFASYHAYPYYPDFLSLQPSYLTYKRSRDGKVDPYAGYLHELRAHHAGQAVMITETGVPTGTGVAHVGPLGRDQGDHSEQQEGKIDADLIRDVADENYAGAILFEYTDEWFKGTWNTQDFEFPRDRRALWRNVLTNEEQFGLVASEPVRSNGWHALSSSLRATSDAAYLYVDIKRPKLPLTLGLDVQPGRGGGLPGTNGVGPGADVAITIGPGRRASIVRAGFADPTQWEWGVHGKLFPVDMAALQPGSGKWFAPSLIIDRPYTVPSTGVRRPAEFKDLGTLPWGSPKKDGRNLIDGSRGSIELRIPWSLLGFADPSSRSVFVPRADGTFAATTVKRIGFATVGRGGKHERARSLPLRGWSTVKWHERRKAGWPYVRSAFASLARR
jgi:hypothetical protein